MVDKDGPQKQILYLDRVTYSQPYVWSLGERFGARCCIVNHIPTIQELAPRIGEFDMMVIEPMEFCSVSPGRFHAPGIIRAAQGANVPILAYSTMRETELGQFGFTQELYDHYMRKLGHSPDEFYDLVGRILEGPLDRVTIP
jgi:hypothetical protein